MTAFLADERHWRQVWNPEFSAGESVNYRRNREMTTLYMTIPPSTVRTWPVM